MRSEDERVRWHAASDAELAAAVRTGDYGALREFYARFEPLLARYAARAGVLSPSWEEDAHDVLCDVVLALIAPKRASRTRDDVRDIHAYIQRAFRNRMLSARRSAQRRDERDARATSTAAKTGERLIRSSFSESTLRASGAEELATIDASPAIARLAAVLDAALTTEERQMLAWVSSNVPMREAAAWQHISYSAAKVRLSRTRSRMRELALRHINECSGGERVELLDFFARMGSSARTVGTGGSHGNV